MPVEDAGLRSHAKAGHSPIRREREVLLAVVFEQDAHYCSAVFVEPDARRVCAAALKLANLGIEQAVTDADQPLARAGALTIEVAVRSACDRVGGRAVAG